MLGRSTGAVTISDLSVMMALVFALRAVSRAILI